MNVFEDLIEELKEENLLEETVIDIERSKDKKKQTELFSEAEQNASINSSPANTQPDLDKPQTLSATESIDDFSFETSEAAEATPFEHDVPEISKPLNSRDFFRKRAMDEVSSLQMVEHVLSGVEREHMKVVTEPYDDLEAKKALHRFLQVSEDPKSEACNEAEYQLLQETQSWYTALADRDGEISIANIRRFCENSRPALSSQALMSLARFYRNSPYNELVRGKFDFVMTRLFGREIDGDRRILLFSRKDMIGHIKTLYENWSSIEIFGLEDQESRIEPAVVQFGQFAAEAERSIDLHSLLETNVFEKIREFKEELGELFFAPDVTAAAIDCNVRIGNRFVDLIAEARESERTSEFEEKYGYEYDQLISNTTGKTLLLVELLNGSSDTTRIYDDEDDEKIVINIDGVKKSVKQKQKASFALFGVNKWFLAITILVLVASVGVYIAVDMFATSQTRATIATNIDITTTDLKQHLRMARHTKETLYAVTDDTWDNLSEDERKAFLKKVLEFAQERGLKDVSLLNSKGRSVGYASINKLELIAIL